MNSADLVAHLRSRTLNTYRSRMRANRNFDQQAADRLEALEARLAEAMEVLREIIKHLGDIEDGNGDPAPEIQAARRLVEKEDGRG